MTDVSLNANAEIENLETFYLLYCGDAPKADLKQHLREIINYLLMFKNEQTCLNYIQSRSISDRIILIVKGSIAEKLLPKIVHLRQIISIYIYTSEKKSKEHWTKNVEKIKGIFSHRSELIQRLHIDQNTEETNKFNDILSISVLCSKKVHNILFFNSFDDDFVHSQILFDCLINIKSFSNDKTPFIHLCKQQYKHNSNGLDSIDEFEKHYTSEKCLWWYSKRSFISHIINKALGTKNITLLLLCQFFICDMKKQLMLNKNVTFHRVYRGQLFSKSEFELFKRFLGETISINNFFLTFSNRNKVRSDLLSLTVPKDMIKVLFEIKTNSHLDTTPIFSNITLVTNSSSNNEEILFVFGSIFRIIRIYNDDDQLWHIQLSLISSKHKQIESIIQEKKVYYQIIENDPISFGFILQHMKKYDEAEKYYLYLINQSPKINENISRCYHALGEITQWQGDYYSSLNCYNKSLEIDLSLSKEEDENIATTYNSIAVVYSKTGDYERALEYYKKSLSILSKTLGEDHLDVAMCCNNIGIVYQETKRYLDALEYYHKAWNIRQQHLPNHHIDLGQSHVCIANINYHLNHYDIALEHYNSALEIFEKCLPSDHMNIAMIFQNMGYVYQKKGQLRNALSSMKQAIEVYHYVLPITHPDIVNLEQVVDSISSKL